MVNQKKWYQSKVLWSNALAILAGVLMALQGQVEAGVPLSVLGVANIALRVVTSHKLIM